MLRILVHGNQWQQVSQSLPGDATLLRHECDTCGPIVLGIPSVARWTAYFFGGFAVTLIFFIWISILSQGMCLFCLLRVLKHMIKISDLQQKQIDVLASQIFPEKPEV